MKDQVTESQGTTSQVGENGTVRKDTDINDAKILEEI